MDIATDGRYATAQAAQAAQANASEFLWYWAQANASEEVIRHGNGCVRRFGHGWTKP